MQSSDFRNDFCFDCREYIKPGDLIQFDSMFACPTADNVARHESIVSCGTVVAVYESFVIVKLRKIVEGVNRWNIRTVNNRKVSGKGGCFA